MVLDILKDQLKVKFLLKWSQEVQDLYQRTPQDQIYAAIGIVVLTTFFLAFLRLFKRKASNTVVLAGLSSSGKTFLFYQLRDGFIPPQDTVTPKEPNADTFVLFSERSKKGKIKPVHVVDVPGRSKLDEFVPEASAVVFVVDAIDFIFKCSAASEYLCELLTNESVVKKKIPVLILCNKVDVVCSCSKDFIEFLLEEGFHKSLRRRAGVTSELRHGVARRLFKFSQCRNRVTLGESSGLTGDIYELEEFIREYVKP